VIQLTGRVEFCREDGGAALIARVGDHVPEGEDEGDHVFVQIQSYDERAWSDSKRVQTQAHPEARLLEGRHVRVTIEVLDP
jgi:hypothetical protein